MAYFGMDGRSPRTRGRRPRRTQRLACVRSIPAYAGEATRIITDHTALEVDPRVRGGGSLYLSGRAYPSGRSPRTRGRLRQTKVFQVAHGSIPAYAGEANARGPSLSLDKVDPRVRGGGKRHHSGRLSRLGRSPRTRGRPSSPISNRKIFRSIPAYAGEAVYTCLDGHTHQVDPRVRGGGSDN